MVVSRAAVNLRLAPLFLCGAAMDHGKTYMVQCTTLMILSSIMGTYRLTSMVLSGLARNAHGSLPGDTTGPVPSAYSTIITPCAYCTIAVPCAHVR